MKAIKDMSGQRLGKLTVIAFDKIDEYGKAIWTCRCDCGVIKPIQGCRLRKTYKPTRSCGCLITAGLISRSKTHGMRKSSEYTIWTDMKQRCFNPNDPYYKDYGGRGISVCQEWADSFESFYEHIGQRPSKRHTIERLNGSGNYEPGNVKWATWEEQANNRRNSVHITHNGKTRTLSQWDREFNAPRGGVRSRLNKGITMENIEAEFSTAALT